MYRLAVLEPGSEDESFRVVNTVHFAHHIHIVYAKTLPLTWIHSKHRRAILRLDFFLVYSGYAT